MSTGELREAVRRFAESRGHEKRVKVNSGVSTIDVSSAGETGRIEGYYGFNSNIIPSPNKEIDDELYLHFCNFPYLLIQT